MIICMRENEVRELFKVSVSSLLRQIYINIIYIIRHTLQVFIYQGFYLKLIKIRCGGSKDRKKIKKRAIIPTSDRSIFETCNYQVDWG